MAKQPEPIEETSQTIELPLTEIPPNTQILVEESLDDEDSVITSAIPLTPRDITNQKAKEARDSRKLPPIPGYSPSLLQLVEWFKLLDEAMWTHVVPYMYRSWPKIVRQLSDPENKKYIDIICKDQVDRGLIEYLNTNHGGGIYKFIIVDLDQKTARNSYKTIMEMSFKIDDNEYPPILNLKEIDVNEKKNMGFINKMVSEGRMDAKGNIMQTQQNGNGMGGNSAELVGAVGQIYEKFSNAYTSANKEQQATVNKLLTELLGRKPDDGGINQLLLEKLKQDDPNKQTAMMLQMLTTMIGLMPKQEKPDTSIFQLLITQMQQSAERQMEMMKMMFTMQNGGEKEDFLDKLAKYRTTIPELFSGGHREPKKETAEIILDGVKEFALPAIGLVSQFLQLRGANPIVPVTEDQARTMAGMGGQPQPSHVQNINHKVLPMPSQNTSPNSPPPTSPVKDPEGKPIMDPNNLTMCQKLLIQYGGMLITAIKSGMDGATLADNLEGARPLIGDIYGMLKGQGGEEILKAMESIPEFWNQTGVIYGKEHMEQLIADFLLDPPDNDDDEEEDENIKGKGAGIVQ